MRREASNNSASRRKSWDDWEPSSRKNLVQEIPSITTDMPRAVDRRQVPPSSQPRNQSSQSTNDRSQVVSRSRVRHNQANLNRGQTKSSQDTAPEGIPGPGYCSPPPEMDSTMFFPVGSPVKHKLYGQGIVQTPPNADEQFVEKVLVRVKFSEDNLEWDLPMDGLVHTYE